MQRILFMVAILLVATSHPVAADSSWMSWPTEMSIAPDFMNVQTIAQIDSYLVAYEVNTCSEFRYGPYPPNVKTSIPLPSFVNDVAIYLNGWVHKYPDNNELWGLEARVGPIKLEPGSVTWVQKAGMIYLGSNTENSCLYSIVVGWDKNVLNVDSAGRLIFTQSVSSSNPILFLRGKIPDDFQPSARVALLPAGYLVNFIIDDNRNFLQFGYSIGQRRPNGTWHSDMILKDDNTQQINGVDYMAVLQGADVGMRMFYLKPLKVRKLISGNCIQLGQQKPQEYTWDDLPYDLALPVLAGWNTYNTCSDDEVTAIGVWISNIQYTKPPNGTGTLKFTVYGRDRPFVPEIEVIGFGHNVSTIGYPR